MAKLLFTILYLFVSIYLYSQDRRTLFFGVVKDDAGNILSFASLRIEGTSTGTMCDKNGRFELALPPGNYKIIFSYVGFNSLSFLLQLDSSTINTTIHLVPSEILLSEVVVSGENPAYPIIREAIERKKNWQKLVTSYKARTYAKDMLGSDTVLILISEAYSDLYWRQNDSLREIITDRRQSGSFPEEFQIAKVDNFINLNNDTVVLLNYKFITPLSESAFSYYDYLLRRTFSDSSNNYFEIEVIPLSQIQPLFYGTIIIQDSSFALQKVSLHPNDVFKIPFFTLTKAEISQQFSLYQNRFWFPLEYHLYGEGVPSVMVFSSRKKTAFYSRSIICYDYEINYAISDSIKKLPALTVLTKSAKFDSSLWQNVKYFPLTAHEENAYYRIDSVSRSVLWVKLLTQRLKEYQGIIQALDLRYNRVEGLFLGGKTITSFFENVRFSAGVGFGITDRQAKYSIKPEILLNQDASLWIGAHYFRSTQTFPLNFRIDESVNSVVAFFNGGDYYNYFSGAGGGIHLSFEKYPSFLITFSIVSEQQRSLSKNTDLALNFIGTTKTFRANPSIANGTMKSILLDVFNQEQKIIHLFEEPKNTWRIRLEHSSSEYGSTFNFTSFFSSLSVRIPTMGTSRLFNPYLGISTSLGLSSGDAPLQRSFSFETPISSFAHPHSFRTLKNGDVFADNFYAFSLEHNFRNIPLLLAGVTSANFDFLLRVTSGIMWTRSALLRNSVSMIDGRYTEYTLGVGRILDLFRIDVSYSRSQSSRFVVTLLGGM